MSARLSVRPSVCPHGTYRPHRSDFHEIWYLSVGRDSSAGVATCYGLDGSGIKSLWGTRFSTPAQAGPGAHPASCSMGTRSFPGVKSGWGVTLTTHPLLVPWSWKGRAIPLLPQRAVQPVQSLSARTRVHFTFYLFMWHVWRYAYRFWNLTHL
jgi:hypothetical protein